MMLTEGACKGTHTRSVHAESYPHFNLQFVCLAVVLFAPHHPTSVLLESPDTIPFCNSDSLRAFSAPIYLPLLQALELLVPHNFHP
jgi:hypothetical protein